MQVDFVGSYFIPSGIARKTVSNVVTSPLDFRIVSANDFLAGVTEVKEQ
jgi:hypothetical protein